VDIELIVQKVRMRITADHNFEHAHAFADDDMMTPVRVQVRN